MEEFWSSKPAVGSSNLSGPAKEFMEIISIEKKNWYADYIVHWKPLNVCNYDCSYCSPENHRSIDVEKLPDIDLLLSVADKIKNSIPEGKTLHVNITGGEPFLIPNFNLLLDRLDKHGFLVTVFTNGSMPLRLYEQCFPALKSMIVFVSFHPETADVSKIGKLVTSLRDNGGGVEIRGMMASTLFDKVNDMYSKLNEEGITVNRLRVYPLVNVTENKINPPFSSSRDLEDYNQRPVSNAELVEFMQIFKRDIAEKILSGEIKESEPFVLVSNRWELAMAVSAERDSGTYWKLVVITVFRQSDLYKFKVSGNQVVIEK